MLGHKQKNLTWSRYLEPNCSWLRDVQGICSLVISWHTKTRPNRPSKSVAAVPETLTIARDAGWCGRLLKHLHLTNETKCSKQPNGPISYFNWLGSNRFVSTSIIYRLCNSPKRWARLGIWPRQHHLVAVEDQTCHAETNGFGSEISTPKSASLWFQLYMASAWRKWNMSSFWVWVGPTSRCMAFDPCYLAMFVGAKRSLEIWNDTTWHI